MKRLQRYPSVRVVVIDNNQLTIESRLFISNDGVDSVRLFACEVWRKNHLMVYSLGQFSLRTAVMEKKHALVIFTDTWEIDDLLDAVFLQDRLSADTGAFEYDWRTECTRRNNHETFGTSRQNLLYVGIRMHTRVLDVFNTDSTLIPGLKKSHQNKIFARTG